MITNGAVVQFAIQVSIRNNNSVKRAEVIDRVAAKVGPGHKVDLKHYDKLIIVDVHRVSYLSKLMERIPG
jgi:hypothetical protein